MQTIEFETIIGKDGHIQRPKEYQHFYGKYARFIVLLPENQKSGRKDGNLEAPRGSTKWCQKTTGIWMTSRNNSGR